MSFTLSQLAKLLDGSAVGEDVEITGLAGVEEAQPGDLVFVENRTYLSRAEKSPASAVIVPRGLTVAGKPYLEVKNPRLAFVDALGLFNPPKNLPSGIHPTAICGDGGAIAQDVSVLAYCVLGDNVTLEEGVVIYPHVTIGDDVIIGAGSVLYPNVCLYDHVTVGRRARIHSGTVIGSDGFGYVQVDGDHVKVPHVGGVLIEDDVEIGANCTVDRAKTGVTRIGSGTKIDNLVHIGHNVQIGRNCILAGQVGLAGSVRVEDGVALCGQAGAAPHLTIGQGSIICAQAGVIGNVPPGSTYSGYPARPHQKQMRIHAEEQRLPEMARQMREQIRELERRLAALEDVPRHPEPKAPRPRRLPLGAGTRDGR